MDDDGLCLHDLFSFNDYKRENIEIPLYRSLSNRNEGVLAIELLHSVAASTDPDLTGQVLWPVSRLLSHYLASDQIDLNAKSVLELGAGGTALPSLSAAHCGASTVVATDGNDGAVLDLLHQNIGHQQSLSKAQQCAQQLINCHITDGMEIGKPEILCDRATLPALSCRQLLWGCRRQLRALRNDNQNRPFDIIVAADVVQWPAVVEPLLHTVAAALWIDNADQYVPSHDPVFLLGIVERSTTVYDQFFALAHAMGFVSREIDSKEYFPDGSIPLTCQEHGGRTTKLFELTMNQHSTDVPLLLKPNHKEDCIVGRSFEQTVFLPC